MRASGFRRPISSLINQWSTECSIPKRLRNRVDHRETSFDKQQITSNICGNWARVFSTPSFRQCPESYLSSRQGSTPTFLQNMSASILPRLAVTNRLSPKPTVVDHFGTSGICYSSVTGSSFRVRSQFNNHTISH